MSFHIGQRVICVDDKPTRNGLAMGTLKEGAVYTIRETGIASGFLDDETCVRLEEIVRPCGRDICPYDTPYLTRRFRPVIERKTSIEIFKRLLTPTAKVSA